MPRKVHGCRAAPAARKGVERCAALGARVCFSGSFQEFFHDREMLKLQSFRSFPLALAALVLLGGCAPEPPAAFARTPGTAPQAADPEFPPERAFPPGWAFEPEALPVVESREGVVVTTDPVASEVGAAILRRGGNAVDAAIAVHFALAVVNPEAGNIGGGGFLVARMADGTTAALDFRETAPLGATRDMFLDAQGNPTDASLVGHRAAGVPGSVAGMWEAHRRFGSLSWRELVEPAVHLADTLVVHERLARSLQNYQARLRRYPATAAAYLPGGRPPRVGERFEQRDLAATLRRIASDGKDGFYRGRTAELIAAEMRRGGGLITREDLARYEARWRDPVVFSYRDHTVISMPPPSSGGATMGKMLKILEGYDLRVLGFHSPEHIHLWTEAARRAYVDRNEYLADPDFVPQPLPRMHSAEYAAERRATIDPQRATRSAYVEPGLGPVPIGAGVGVREREQTTHFSVMDREGNAVAVTTTINGYYGSLVTVAGAGFLLNNEMDDFTAKPGVPNLYGLVQGEANRIEPGKRMLSAMTPTIVLSPEGGVRLVTGTPGGSRIITTVAQIVSNVVDFGMDLPTAVAAPRLHHQHLPDEVTYENRGLRAPTAERLRRMGHRLEEQRGYQGDVQSILVRPDGLRVGVADPRLGGAAVGVTETREVVH
jgi:gamma-glutamyltranspeptidase / glutathione hydrolase